MTDDRILDRSASLLCESHEALRERLRTAETERDDARLRADWLAGTAGLLEARVEALTRAAGALLDHMVGKPGDGYRVDSLEPLLANLRAVLGGSEHEG